MDDEWHVLSVRNQPEDVVGFLSDQDACYLSRGTRLFMYKRTSMKEGSALSLGWLGATVFVEMAEVGSVGEVVTDYLVERIQAEQRQHILEFHWDDKKDRLRPVVTLRLPECDGPPDLCDAVEEHCRREAVGRLLRDAEAAISHHEPVTP